MEALEWNKFFQACTFPRYIQSACPNNLEAIETTYGMFYSFRVVGHGISVGHWHEPY